jgi:NADPH:quinone reductase-like Zn-dependent oxidoreductase
MSIPKSCRAVELSAYDGRSFSLVERPVRPPGPGEVVVRMRAAPINPSDLMMLEGRPFAASASASSTTPSVAS